jgi:hypothetical protein
VIAQTAIFNPIEFMESWTSDNRCSIANVTLSVYVNIDGNTYSNGPETMTFYPDGWGMRFLYSDVSLDMANSFHTALIVNSDFQ